jgi:hypothetical protein
MKISDEELKQALLVVMATPSEYLGSLLEQNQGKHESIIHLIEREIELRGQGIKRIPTFKEVVMTYGN